MAFSPSRQIRRTYPAKAGFTLIELAMIIALIAILSSFALVSFRNMEEQRDATMVQSAQASLQAIVTQGAMRMDVNPGNLDPAAVLLAVRSASGQSASGNNGIQFTNSGRQFTVTVVKSRRSAQFTLNANGEITLDSISGFSQYQKGNNGKIAKI